MKTPHRWMLPLFATVAAPALAQTTSVSSLAIASMTPAAPTAPAAFELYLPLRNVTALETLQKAQVDPNSPSFRKWLTPDQFGAQFGPTPATVAAAKAAIQAAGLTVDATNPRSLHVSGTAGAVAKLFSVRLGTVMAANGTTRIVAASRPVLPPALQALGARVVSFSGIPAHRPNVLKTDAKPIPDNRYGPDGPYWFTDLKQAYDYPAYTSTLPGGARLDGTGVRAAVVISDRVRNSDLQAFFDHEKFTAVSGTAAPQVNTVAINGGGVVDGDGSFEASLDVQQINGGAPGAKVTVVSLPDLSDDNIIDGYNYIVNSNKYDIVNSSFGLCELYYLPQYNGGGDFSDIPRTYDEIFEQGNVQGITFFVSSGDNGGLECISTNYFNKPGTNGKFVKGVSSPAASKYVTAVGGGNLVTTGGKTLRAGYVGENGYGDPLIAYDVYGTGGTVSGGYWGAGGGISVISTQPSYQYGVNTGSKTHRTLPDVGMQVGGCPAGISQLPCGPDRSAAITAYDVGKGGGYYGVIGTSVSSPEFAGAVALYIQAQGTRVGNINTYLYQIGAAQTGAGGINAPAATQFYHRNIPGFDGVYSDTVPSTDYNYIVGNGTPDVRMLFNMTKYGKAGNPQTATNP